MFISLGYIDGNSYIDNACVRDTSEFTEEQLKALYAGEVIEDYDGTTVYLCEE